MNKEKLIFWWYDRFGTVKKSILLILAYISFFAAAYFVGSGLFLIGFSLIEIGPANNYTEEIKWGIKLIFVGVVGYVAFWSLFRGLLWIIDDFKEAEESSDTNLSKLEKLGELKEKGIITDEEFQEKKEKLLSDI